eukprot:jgi/Psemu1/36929/gm1.36929_g
MATTRIAITNDRKNCLEGDAYKKKYRSWVLLSLALVIVSVSSGLIYGWPALRSQLQNVDGSILTEEQFGLMYTIGSWSTQGGRLFMGMARDRFGTKLVTCSALMACMLGLIGVGVCGPDQFVALNISLFLVGLGSGAQLCLQPIAELFPNHGGIVLSTLSGAFQISGLMFLILTAASKSRRHSILAFAGVIAVLTILSAILLPATDSFLITEETSSTSVAIAGVEVSGNEGEGKHERIDQDQESEEEMVAKGNHGLKNGESPVDAVPEVLFNVTGIGINGDSPNDLTIGSDRSSQPTAIQQMKTKEYVLLCIWFSIVIIPMQFYVGIIGFQLETVGDDTGFYTDIFAYCFAGAAITAPLAGWIADRFGLGIAQGLSTLLIAISIFLLAAKDSITLNTHAFGFAVYGIGRMGIFGLYFTNCGKRFGYANYGTLAGLGLLISAILSLLQYPLIAWTVDGYSRAVNTFWGVVLVLLAPYFVWMYQRERFADSAMSRMQRR